MTDRSPTPQPFAAAATASSATGAARAPHLVDTTMFWSPTGGGVRRYLLAKRKWLMRQGWRHSIVVPGGSDQEAPDAPPEATHDVIDCGGVPLPFSGGYRVPVSRSAASALLQSLRPNIIEVGDPYRLAWAALDAGQRLGVPTVAFCHSNIAAMAARIGGSNGLAAGWMARGAAAYLARTYRRFDLVLAPSRAMVQVLLDMGVSGARQQPLGVDIRRFHPLRADPFWRGRLGLPPNARVLVYAGRFAPEKNLQQLADAVQSLGPGHLLIAIGNGPAPPRGSRVRLLPHQHDVGELATLIASADAFVHAGDQETFGLAALEAMACGTPVIGRNAAGLSELLDGAGMLVDSPEPAAWADAMSALFADGRDVWARRARARAEQHDWRRVLPSLIGHYEDAMRSAPRQAGGSGAGSALGTPSQAGVWRQSIHPSQQDLG